MTQSSTSVTEADRIAVTNLFKQIAEYGRKVRERREAEAKAGERALIASPSESVADDNTSDTA